MEHGHRASASEDSHRHFPSLLCGVARREPHTFATKVLKGERIDKMKTRTGQRLTDSHLVQLNKAKHPWLPAVYEHLSGYVHFSGAHIADSIEGFDDEDRTVQFLVSDQDLKFPEFSWIEILECFREATAILGTFLQGWVQPRSCQMLNSKRYAAAPNHSVKRTPYSVLRTLPVAAHLER